LLEHDRPVRKADAGGIQQVAVNRTVLVEPTVDDPGRRRRGRRRNRRCGQARLHRQ